MSIPNEALQKLLQEIEAKAAQSQQQIAVVKAQISGKSRESRMLQLTKNELSTLPDEANVYEGVGRMFVRSPNGQVKGKLETQAAEVKAEAENLGKKLTYLETTAKNSREHIDQLLKSGGRS